MRLQRLEYFKKRLLEMLIYVFFSDFQVYNMGGERRLSQLETTSKLAQAIAGSAPSAGFRSGTTPLETGLELELIHLAFSVSLPQLGQFLA